MINFKNKDEVLPSLLIVLSLLIFLGCLVSMVFFKPPTTAGVAAGRQRSISTIQKEIATSEQRAQEAQVSVRTRLWQGDPEAVTAAVLAQLTRQTNQSGVQLVAFRPQKLQALEGVSELPFSVQLTGSYPKVRALVAALEVSSSRLVVRSFQFASTDGASDAITATVGVSAYYLPPALVEAVPEKGGSRG